MEYEPDNKCELLSPAGDLEAAYAAFANGADAVYLGLKRFSARSGATNFSKDDILQIVSYARKLEPIRKVYVAVNTLIKEDEIGDLIDMLCIIDMAGVNGVIIQDWGVYNLIKNYFPKLAIHASTQMAVHNSAGCEIFKSLGFSRVVLAREMTLDEIKDASSQGIETEVFVHGALCYSYSGLCLYSAMTYKASANRGCCAYPCREFFSSKKESGYFFSMKDLAILDDIKKLREVGVTSLKIEGRKRTVNYTASVTELYRKILDNNLLKGEKERLIEKAKISFGRKWTSLYLASRDNQDVIDKNTTGHIGIEAGQVARFYKKGKTSYVGFIASVDFSKHDVLKIELLELYKVFSFPVADILIKEKGKNKKIFEVKKGQDVDVALPDDCPFIANGSRIFCASSKDLKSQINLGKSVNAKEALYGLDVDLQVAEKQIGASILVKLLDGDVLEVFFASEGHFTKALKNNTSEILEAFAKLGGTDFYVSNIKLRGDDFFVPLSFIKDFRRKMVAKLEQSIENAFLKKSQNVKEQVINEERSVIIDNVKYIGAFSNFKHLQLLEKELDNFHEVMILIDAVDIKEIVELSKIYQDRLRLLMPIICRNEDYLKLKDKVSELLKLGFKKWEITGLWCFSLLETLPRKDAVINLGLNITSSWSLYVMNSQSAKTLLDFGISRFTLCLEDDEDNFLRIAKTYPQNAALTIFHNTPLFISANNALDIVEDTEIESKKKQKLIIKKHQKNYDVINKQPFICDDKKLNCKFIKLDFVSNMLELKAINNIIRTKVYKA